MDRWRNRVAVVTGASSGIGSAIVKDLIEAKLIVVGLARRIDRIREIRCTLPRELQNRLHGLKCDISKESEVDASFDWVEKTLGGVDVLINSAGIFPTGPFLSSMDTDLIRRTIDINIMGAVMCTRKAFQSMKARNFNGHIILMNSVGGHTIPTMPHDHSYNIYPATKHAITAITEILRQEFHNLDTKVKITSISPGLTDTEMIREFKMKNEKVPLLQAKDISSAILYTLSTPPHAQVHEIIIKPVGEIFWSF